MSEKPYSYSLIEENHQPLFGNYYLASNDKEIIGLMLVAKNNDELYLIKFFELKNDDQDVESYFKGELVSANLDFDWITTKLLLNFMDQLLEKDLILTKIINLDEVFDFDSKQVHLYKINLANFNNVGFVAELSKEDQLEMVSKLLVRNEQTHQLGTGPLIDDLTDSQVYLLDTLFDNN